MDYIDVKDVCRMFGKDKTTIYKWIKKGMPSHKIGGGRKFLKYELERWIQKGDKDFTPSEYVNTPFGRGRFLRYDKDKDKVIVEMDCMYQVEFNANDCYEI